MAARDLLIDNPSESGCRAACAGRHHEQTRRHSCRLAGRSLPEDFSLEKHKRIFLRMGDLHERGEN